MNKGVVLVLLCTILSFGNGEPQMETDANRLILTASDVSFRLADDTGENNTGVVNWGKKREGRGWKKREKREREMERRQWKERKPKQKVLFFIIFFSP